MAPTSLSWSSFISLSLTPTIRSMNEPSINSLKLPCFYVESSKKCSKPVSVSSSGLQRNPRKDLSRILRTDAAIKGVENKANSLSYKHQQLWPRAVLESLDEAIEALRWEAALKVGPARASVLFSCYYYYHYYYLCLNSCCHILCNYWLYWMFWHSS